jgi:hypothetical protein
MASVRYPNACRLTLGGLFISHAGADRERIREVIVPLVFKRLPADGYFMHSRASGGADDYKGLVQAALHWCDKFLLVISDNSLVNLWVQAEVEWALNHTRPLLVVRLDHHTWQDFLHKLELGPRELALESVPVFDFRASVEDAQNKLALALDQLLARLPRRGLEEL